jgi:XTP/dITP diphosphohydrolase
MMTILAATTNCHKIAEYREMIPACLVKLSALADFTTYPEAIENGASFEDNAAIKARVYSRHFKIPVFADDSGLEVPALNNAPGVNSARYAGADANYPRNNALLLENMRHIPDENRLARFVCVICFKDGQDEFFFRGQTEGIILHELRGQVGFGYDPLFFAPELGKTYAELTMAEKNLLSHRGKALRLFLRFLQDRIAAGR